MKTPEEIKEGLECCVSSIHICEDCPYESYNNVTRTHTCVEELEVDALAYIQQLEAKVAELGKVERERDAAIADMERMQGLICQCCKEYYQPDPNVRKWACRVYGDDWATMSEDGLLCCSKFKWRGLQEEQAG